MRRVLQELPQVHVGRRLYRQRIVRGPILGESGKRCLFQIDHIAGIISLDADVPLEDRPQVLAVAVACAWQRVVVPLEKPRPREWA